MQYTHIGGAARPPACSLTYFSICSHNPNCPYLHQQATLCNVEGKGVPVKGEVFEVTTDDIKKFDELEGFAGGNILRNVYTRVSAFMAYICTIHYIESESLVCALYFGIQWISSIVYARVL